MKFASWNVNGLRACLKNGFPEAFGSIGADVFCLQETKLQEGQVTLDLPGYYQYWNYAEKKGYSGTAVFSRQEPLSVTMGLGIPDLDGEGRVITLEFPRFFLTNVYVPNSREELERLDYRMYWEDSFRTYIKSLDENKPVVFCGDLNVAHEEIDLKNPGPNRGKAGFTDEEREKFSELLSTGFTDTFRMLYPDRTGAYSWWSYRFHARDRNAGWRIDYFLVSDRIRDRVKSAEILDNIYGSDHCPVTLDLDTESL
ncbi:MAG: exodeoxyribonuclease III [Oscillospiraceae bacterium]|jgi:exodeoxyribonuclease-3